MVKLIFDGSNILFRVASMVEKRHAEPGGNFNDDEEKNAFALHLGLNSILKYVKKFKPDEIALAFEGRNNWRKAYTSENANVIAKQYKANRVATDKSLTFFELIDSFKLLIKEHTSILCLAVDGLEGDDIIAGYVQEAAENKDDKIILVSGDKDFMQLGKYANFMLIDPASGKDRITAEPNFNSEYFMFEKCIRGDAGDNVMSAFPRVRKTRLDKAFTSDYEMTQLMQEEWTSPMEDKDGALILDEDGNPKVRTNVVGVLFEHNKVLMDLEHQPAHVRARITEGLAAARANVGKYNHFHFMRFLGKHKLNAIAEQAHLYTAMFSAGASNGATRKHIIEKQSINTEGSVDASEYLNKSKPAKNIWGF